MFVTPRRVRGGGEQIVRQEEVNDVHQGTFQATFDIDLDNVEMIGFPTTATTTTITTTTTTTTTTTNKQIYLPCKICSKVVNTKSMSKHRKSKSCIMTEKNAPGIVRETSIRAPGIVRQLSK